MFHRWYLTPQKISKMSNQSSSSCWKCRNVVGSFFHMWWTCGEIMSCWKRIHCWLQIILNIRFEMNAKFYLLCIPPNNLCSKAKGFFFYATTAARLLLVARWRSPTLPTEDDWFDMMLYFNNLAFLSRSLGVNFDNEVQGWWNKFSKIAESRV